MRSSFGPLTTLGFRTLMGAEGRRRVLERYAVDRVVDGVDRLYRELLAAGPAEPPSAK